MKELIKICKVNPNGSLSILDEKNLLVILDESKMILVTKYKGETYEIKGNFQFQYIEVKP